MDTLSNLSGNEKGSSAKIRFIPKILALFFTVLLGIEVGLRIFFSVPQFQPLLFVNESLSWRRNWVARHGDTEDITYAFDRYDPLLGWRNQPDVRGMEVFDDKTLNTNNHGFRGIVDTSYEKEPDRLRIAVLGDSFTFGDEVSDEETYVHFIQQKIPEAEIINMGVHGYGHDQIFLFYESEGQRFSPDVVILGFTKIDMERNVLDFRDFAKPVFVEENGQIKLQNNPVPTPEEVLRTDWIRPRLMDGYAIIKESIAIRSGARQQREETVTTLILKRLASSIRTSGAVPVFVYLPFAPEVLEPDPLTSGEAYFFSLCREIPDISCFSSRPAFLEYLRSGSELKIDFHWDDQGHKIIADSLYDFLVNDFDGILP